MEGSLFMTACGIEKDRAGDPYLRGQEVCLHGEAWRGSCQAGDADVDSCPSDKIASISGSAVPVCSHAH